MSRLARTLVLAVTLAASPALAAEGPPHAPPGATPSAAVAKQETCAHGVRAALCTRCNPKLAPVYKAKGDWCPEHDRPESQCAPCHPDLARKGVK